MKSVGLSAIAYCRVVEMVARGKQYRDANISDTYLWLQVSYPGCQVCHYFIFFIIFFIFITD